jgi:adenylate kinase
METRLEETKSRGETVRADDNPESFKIRLDAYRVQTAPLADYYRERGKLRTVDGMAEVGEVSRSVDQALGVETAESMVGGG